MNEIVWLLMITPCGNSSDNQQKMAIEEQGVALCTNQYHDDREGTGFETDCCLGNQRTFKGGYTHTHTCMWNPQKLIFLLQRFSFEY